MLFKAVIFDVSGTILDDIYPVWRAYSEAYDAFGFEGLRTLKEFKERVKFPVPEFHKDNGIPQDLIGEVDRKALKFYHRYAYLVTMFPEVEDVLCQLRKKGVLLGIASTIPTLFLTQHLGRFEIEGYFGAITGRNDCDEEKPSPKPILATLDKLRVEPPEAMYVGDMEEDIIAGRRANTYTMAISRSESYHSHLRLKRQNPDYLFSSLDELLLLFRGLNK